MTRRCNPRRAARQVLKGLAWAVVALVYLTWDAAHQEDLEE